MSRLLVNDGRRWTEGIQVEGSGIVASTQRQDNQDCHESQGREEGEEGDPRHQLAVTATATESLPPVASSFEQLFQSARLATLCVRASSLPLPSS